MDDEKLKRAMEFLLEQHARFNDEMSKTKETLDQLVASQARISASQAGLSESQLKSAAAQERMAADLQLLTGKVLDLADSVTRMAAQMEAGRAETREAINDLIVANEVTRELAANVARLAIGTSQRASNPESNQ